jgi:hypothetical protein
MVGCGIALATVSLAAYGRRCSPRILQSAFVAERLEYKLSRSSSDFLLAVGSAGRRLMIPVVRSRTPVGAGFPQQAAPAAVSETGTTLSIKVEPLGKDAVEGAILRG